MITKFFGNKNDNKETNGKRQVKSSNKNSKKNEKPPLIEDINIRLYGDSPTVNTIRDIINEINTGERTRGNIDVTMQSVEVQFGIANSHLQGGKRVSIPVSDRSLYIPGG